MTDAPKQPPIPPWEREQAEAYLAEEAQRREFDKRETESRLTAEQVLLAAQFDQLLAQRKADQSLLKGVNAGELNPVLGRLGSSDSELRQIATALYATGRDLRRPEWVIVITLGICLLLWFVGWFMARELKLQAAAYEDGARHTLGIPAEQAAQQPTPPASR